MIERHFESIGKVDPEGVDKEEESEENTAEASSVTWSDGGNLGQHPGRR
eukprot:CAMPEP_0113428192 /NCGR_PEP_ID=MMETSP0013_2-20120614/31734_1 /TAXON_ID=2843 ORGANISM="Skeletonema costatum, Strain 1716" /NCGR_SAMPLE_ID=MMETSP0013_2 /ASSEMBLY_ACC=CAM_ASM_000158 /LENGTH=48 /DNA_ID=CAMNT_0000316729 /DNA_START=49 /DNA_END=195 /DNA_ORIENTATION=+ /assembly_acc=CAM_ASM_000158